MDFLRLSYNKNQLEAQQSGFKLERKSDEAQTKKQPFLREGWIKKFLYCIAKADPQGSAFALLVVFS